MILPHTFLLIKRAESAITKTLGGREKKRKYNSDQCRHDLLSFLLRTSVLERGQERGCDERRYQCVHWVQVYLRHQATEFTTSCGPPKRKTIFSHCTARNWIQSVIMTSLRRAAANHAAILRWHHVKIGYVARRDQIGITWCRDFRISNAPSQDVFNDLVTKLL